jgi:hypothetical protein
MLRFLPMLLMGIICCFTVGLTVGKVHIHYLIGEQSLPRRRVIARIPISKAEVI